MKKLTIKQKKFADEYIISGNATQAAIKAGYKNDVSGRENLQKPTIKNYIDERMKELEQEAIANQTEVLKFLTSIMRGEQTEQTLISDGSEQGQRITNIEVSAKDRIKAAELLGKRYGSWTDKVDLSSDLTLIFEDDYGD
ncbi:terminase small subunit [Finegoldia magna]|uniref:terminase small subunit n=1 Tax=Finegoldia magna TaxID=1260 RepID=UPI000763CC33|nr:terminase small subunit [Finegoldia magna]